MSEAKEVFDNLIIRSSTQTSVRIQKIKSTQDAIRRLQREEEAITKAKKSVKKFTEKDDEQSDGILRPRDYLMIHHRIHRV
ncbi:hypothetical protein HanXRQr2_Chr08g0356911 [Helianthus annuus]|uniref:Uncharacterized protein n=1 Tax=Helianthus annuus TaxID=4232 RepID=A0A251S989_HELAN|nr:hypothetical protein HanXRQr2_Chr08g0356911 [Helianthus annuus]KAJ0540125.1 hypothetical protein HanHA300_Chr08g0294681 [Helianthus annuus]KAJ0548552.1 hypothetical protein HanIR_Chr08g0385091 [Helianthus annuus]KAJ0554870.1 hypothetical protein HanHA89_Chr08g0313211 [Helianthus annuus]KAJ0720433.1 hypothetical protein HanLR1_Chr08g0293511 [Helianthus annuus]